MILALCFMPFLSACSDASNNSKSERAEKSDPDKGEVVVKLNSETYRIVLEKCYKKTESGRSVFLIRSKKSTGKAASPSCSVQGAKSKKMEYAAITFALEGGARYQGGSTVTGEMKFTEFENNKIDYKGNVERVITGDDGLALRDNTELEFKVICRQIYL